MGDVIYVRTTDGVLLRFEDTAVIKAWVDSGRLSRTADRYLAADQRWRPISDLFGTDPVGITAIQGNETVVKKPNVNVESHAPMGQQQSVDPNATTREIRPVEVKRQSQPPEKPQHGRSDVWAIEHKEVPSHVLWASDPEDSVYIARRRKHLIAIALLGFVVVIGVAMILGLGDLFKGQVKTTGSETGAIPPRTVTAESPVVSPPSVPELRPPEPAYPSAPQDAAHIEIAPPMKAPSVQVETREDASEKLSSELKPRERVVVPKTRKEELPGGESGTRPAEKPSDVPDTYEGHMAAGNRLIVKDPAKAAVHYQAAARLAPGRVEPLHRLGDCEFAMGDLKAAASHYQEVLKIRDYGPSLIGLARVHQKLGNMNEARYYYSRYLEVNPSGSQAEEARRFLGE